MGLISRVSSRTYRKCEMSTLDGLETKLNQLETKRQRLNRELMKITQAIDDIEEEEKLTRRQQEAEYSRISKEAEFEGATDKNQIISSIQIRANAISQKYFGFKLRQHQLQGIEACERDKDCMCIMAT